MTSQREQQARPAAWSTSTPCMQTVCYVQPVGRSLIHRNSWKRPFFTMPRRCVAAGCSNTTKDGVSLHIFPLDPKFRRIWAQKVRLSRAKWTGPSKHSYLCSTHFDESCFEPSMNASIGLKKVRRLLPMQYPKSSGLRGNSQELARKSEGVSSRKEKESG